MTLKPKDDRSAAGMRLVAVNIGTGVALGFVAVAAIVITDLEGIGTLLRQSDQGLVAWTLLTAGFVTLAVAGAVSTAVMTMGDSDRPARPTGGSGGRIRSWMLPPAAFRPIPIMSARPLAVRVRRAR